LKRCVAIVALAALITLAVGCGTTEEEQAQTDWEARSGLAWSEFEAAYKSAWTEGCEAAQKRMDAGDPDAFMFNSDCGLPANVSDSNGLPLSPPSDPQQVGDELGRFDGCVETFALRDESFDACPIEP
jgi:hypothetical protein